MPTVAEILDQFRRVDDPELGANLVELGLIYDVTVEEETVHIVMTLTTQGCPMHAALLPAVRAAVLALPGVESVDVELVWDPPWTPERMSPLGAFALGWQQWTGMHLLRPFGAVMLR